MSDSVMEVAGVSKRFGGLQALHDLSFSVRRGSITAVIGPNGAGKTTLINVMSGFVRSDTGSISVNGIQLTGARSHEFAPRGVARTFQSAQIFHSMTVLENVLAGCHCRGRAGLCSAALRLPAQRREEGRLMEESRQCLAMVGLSAYADRPSGSLPIGMQRLLEIARALATRPQVLLLDEPAAGLNTQETRTLGDLIRAIRGQGVTILIVEHDMELVMEISEEILVLNFGERIAWGTPEAIQSDPNVIAVYLGADGDPGVPGE